MDAADTMIKPQAFAELVTDSLSCLTKAYMLTPSRSTQDYVVFLRSSVIWMKVHYDSQRSHELGIIVGREPDVLPAFGLAEILRCLGCPEEEVLKVDLMQTVDEDVMKTHLCKSAGLLIDYAAPVLRGESAAFGALQEWRAMAAAAYTTTILMKQLENSVESAWVSKNYGEVVRLLAPYRNELDLKLLRRLSFAETKVDNG